MFCQKFGDGDRSFSMKLRFEEESTGAELEVQCIFSVVVFHLGCFHSKKEYFYHFCVAAFNCRKAAKNRCDDKSLVGDISSQKNGSSKWHIEGFG